MPSNRSVVYERPGHALSLARMRTEELLLDVKIQVRGETFKAHKLVLVATTPLFERMFLNGFREGNENRVTLGSVTVENMKAFVAFAYAGRITLTDDNVESLMIDADFLGLSDVTDECAEFLAADLRARNVFKVRELADALHCARLRERCDAYVRQNFERLAKTEGYLAIGLDWLREIVSSDDLRATSGDTVINAILAWVKHDSDDRSRHFSDLLACVKQCHLALQYSADRVIKDELISSAPEFE